MVDLDRRRFLQIAGGAAAATMLDESIARAAAIPANRRHRHPQGRRAHRRPDAGEPLLRPLLRHAARRPRLRRPAPGARCRAASRSGTSPTAPREVPAVPTRASTTSALAFLEDLPHGWTDGQAAFNRGQLRPVGAGQGHDDDGLPRARGHRRSTTRSPTPSPSATPTTARSSAPPTRTATTCGPAGPATTARAAARCSTTTSSATTGRPTPSGSSRPASRGRSTRTSGDGLDAAGSWGWTVRRLHRQLRRQLAALLQPATATPQPGDAAVREGPHRHRTRATGRTSSTSCAPTSQAGTLPQVSLDRRARGLHRAPELAGQLRRLVHLPGPGRPHRRTPRCGARPSLFITYDENDGFFDHLVPPYPQLACHPGRLDGADRPTSSTTASTAARPLRPGPARADDRRLAVEHGRLGLLGDVRPHVGHPVHGGALRRQGAEHHARGAAPSPATSPSAFDFSKTVQKVPALPSTTAGSPSTTSATPPTSRRRPRRARCRARSRAPAPRARPPTTSTSVSSRPRGADHRRPRQPRPPRQPTCRPRLIEPAGPAAQLHGRGRRRAAGHVARQRRLRHPPARAQRLLPPFRG